MIQARITVAFATSDGQVIETFEMPAGCQIRDLLALAAVRARFPSLITGSQSVGIFGRVAEADTCLRPGDRIELYRPLKGDPKETRRLRGSMRRERQLKSAAP